MNEEMDDDVIDAVNNAKSGEIVLRTKGFGLPTAVMPNYFMCVNFSAILSIKGNGTLSVES